MMTYIEHDSRKFPWQGLIILLFCLMALFWPVSTLTMLRFLFGAYALADGLIALLVGQLDRDELYQRRMVLLRGLASITLGLFICLGSSITAVTLVIIITSWAILARVFEAIAVKVPVNEKQVIWGNLIKNKMLRQR